MSEQLTFTYDSLGSILRIMITALFESTYEMRDITVYHQCFDGKVDDYFENIAAKLYPTGCNLGKTELEAMTQYLYNSMQRDPECHTAYVVYDKIHMDSWVYFYPDNEIRYARTGEHTAIVSDMCMDYFKDVDDIDDDYLKNFILENFEIRSSFSTIETISNDAPFIADLIRTGRFQRERIQSL